MWSAQAQAERLTLLVADNKAGYFGVRHKHGRSKPYEARLRHGGKDVNLGSFTTAEEAALCVARSPEGQAAAKKAATAAPPLTSEEARQQAQAERLTLLVTGSKTGYYGVNHKPGYPRPYQASTTRLMRICTWRGALSTANAQRTPALPGGGSSPGSSECEGKTKKVQCLFVTLCIPPLKNDAKKQNNTNPLPCGSVKQTKLLVCCYSAGSLNLSRSRPRKRQVEAAGSCQEVPKYGGACRL